MLKTHTTMLALSGSPWLRMPTGSPRLSALACPHTATPSFVSPKHHVVAPAATQGTDRRARMAMFVDFEAGRIALPIGQGYGRSAPIARRC